MRRCISGAQLALLSALLIVFASACSSEPTSAPSQTEAPTSTKIPAPPASPEPKPLSNLTVSDAVPTLEQLKDMGIGDEPAACFIATIDPEGTGRVESAERFLQAFASCL